MTDTRDINATGPEYPFPPGPGSNAIGKFEIGVSPVGDIPAFRWESTLMSQFANSPALTSIIGSFFDAADQTRNAEAFFDNIWNVDTANDYGLDVWGRIVGVNRVLRISTVSYFGFAEALPGALGFNSSVSLYNGTWVQSGANQGGGSFFNGGALTSNYRLETESYRRLIMAKAAFNITDCAIPSINQLLLDLFPNRGNCYVTDGYQGISYFGFAESQNALTFGEGIFYDGQTVPKMIMAYVFEFPLSPVELAIVTQSGVLPKPTGVHAQVIVNGQTIVS